MRTILLCSAFVAHCASAQMPLPFWERHDSTHVVLAQLPDATLWPDTFWANGLIPVPVDRFDTIVVDQCCTDPDPPNLMARVKRWPVDTANGFLPLFTERMDADTAHWFVLGAWRNEPDTLIPLTAQPNALTRYIWTDHGLEVQSEQYGTWRTNGIHHVKRSTCVTMARDSLKLMRCSPHAGYRGTEPSVTLLFVQDRLVSAFQDNRGTGLDTWGIFDRTPRAQAITIRAGSEEAVILSSGEVLVRRPSGWELRYREPVIYRGECDCE